MKRLKIILDSIGDSSPIEGWKRVSGGDINDAFYVRTKEREYFIKYNNLAPEGFFSAEKKGLDLIRESNTVQVPDCYGVKDGTEGFLALEWIEGSKTNKTGEMLGTGLARMHQTYGPDFGFSEDSFIGTLPQKNSWFNNWIDYYRNQRLLPQLDAVYKKGRIDTELRRKGDLLLDRLDDYIPNDVRPSLLHGDLWGGNWISGKNGIPHLIDPSVFYGHFEFELAFTELFGGFPANFYSAYSEINPIPKDYSDRKPLYQLFYLLVHLNIFGMAYLPPVERIIHKYVS